ncbi:MAG: SRPBCC domain-containing protein [Alphaproteobacteria bacterium]|nr:SRPBCC domain-containing protein [Alphaproteobacteria bacterium]
MANICLTFGTKAPMEKLTHAIRSLDGLAAWWTGGTSGNPKKGGEIAFRFGDAGGFDMRVEKDSDNHVLWECVGGPEAWHGTHIEFQIVPEDAHTQLMFRHIGWKQEDGFFHHCSMKWATFLLSLKEYVENGVGHPFPNDIKIEATGM